MPQQKRGVICHTIAHKNAETVEEEATENEGQIPPADLQEHEVASDLHDRGGNSLPAEEGLRTDDEVIRHNEGKMMLRKIIQRSHKNV